MSSLDELAKAAQERHKFPLPILPPAQASSTFSISPAPGTYSPLHGQGVSKVEWYFM